MDSRFTCQIFFDACKVGNTIEVRRLLELDGKSRCSSSSFVRLIDPMTGSTALMLACRYGHLEIACLLIKEGAEVNFVRRKFGDCPLHLAALHGHDHIIEVLLRNQANRLVANKAGTYPINIAADMGFSSCVLALAVPPSPPQQVNVIDTDCSHATIQWTPSKSLALPVMEYNVRIINSALDENENLIFLNHVHANSSELDIFRINGPRFVVRDLMPGGEYTVLVRGRNEKGWGLFSKEILVKTKCAKPGRIHCMNAENANGTVQLQWHKPVDNGHPPEEYEILYRVTTEKKVNDDAPCKAYSTPYETKLDSIQRTLTGIQNKIDKFRRNRANKLKEFEPVQVELENHVIKILRKEEDIRNYFIIRQSKLVACKKLRSETFRSTWSRQNSADAELQLLSKEQMIRDAKDSIYHKNGMLIGTWVAEEELRHSKLEVKKLRKQIKSTILK